MPVEPFVAALLPTLPPFPEVDDWPTYRTQSNAGADFLADQVMEPGPEVKERRTISIPVTGGAIDLNIYLPDGDGPHPAHLYIHGGGWVEGDIHTKPVDAICRERCVGASCVVVAVNYRKAPEHRFPTGLNDSYSALLWLAEHADELGVRRDRLSIGGGSAGANLAAAVTLKARDENGPRLILQLLEIPALDLTLTSPSMQTYATGYGLTLDAVQRLIELYLESPDQATHPYVSPLLAEDLSGLPPAFILAAEYDVLRDDGARYAHRLTDAGVPTTLATAHGHVHASHTFTKAIASARTYTDTLIDALRDANQ